MTIGRRKPSVIYLVENDNGETDAIYTDHADAVHHLKQKPKRDLTKYAIFHVQINGPLVVKGRTWIRWKRQQFAVETAIAKAP